jgi:succinate-semialdehyde dehydrogenase/glutarate-semialdehyde dehydrogenase
VLVFPDVDVDAVARPGHRQARNAGQVCIAPQRFFVHASIADLRGDRRQAMGREVVVGHGSTPPPPSAR